MPAIEDIWHAYRHALRGYLTARVGNPDDAEDLLQEVMLRTQAALPTLRDTDRLRPWLYRIAHNASMDFHRNRKPLPHPDDLWSEPDTPERESLEACLTPFLAALPEADQSLLQAVDVEGRSQRALAAEMGLGYSTLKSRVQSARAGLRHLFERCCHLDRDGRGTVTGMTPHQNSCADC